MKNLRIVQETKYTALGMYAVYYVQRRSCYSLFIWYQVGRAYYEASVAVEHANTIVTKRRLRKVQQQPKSKFVVTRTWEI